MGRMPLIGVLAVVAAVAGCTSGSHPDLLTTSGPPGNPYRGPMFVPITASRDNASVHERSGAAGRALECRYPPYGGGQGDYNDGLSEVASTYVDAAEDFIGPSNDGGTAPSTGYRVERKAGRRVLLSYDVRGRTKVAVILRNGITDYLHHTGWGVETWAICDPAEYPAALIDELGIGVWQDAHGRPVPIARVQSFATDDFCGFGDIDSLSIGAPGHETYYVHDSDHVLTKYLRLPYDEAIALPEGATDAGYHRSGRELWFGPDERAIYLVSQSAPDDVQRWPALDRGFGCG